MTSLLFEEWVKELDKQFYAENRKILLFIDNCTAHPKSVQDKLKAIQLCYFPPNATSVLQPLDLGIIKTLKHYYRYALVKQRIENMENGEVFWINLICFLKPNVILDIIDDERGNCIGRYKSSSKGVVCQGFGTNDRTLLPKGGI